MALIAKKFYAKKALAQSPKPNPEPGEVLSVNQKFPDAAGNVNLGNIVYRVNNTPADISGNVNLSTAIVDAPSDATVFSDFPAFTSFSANGLRDHIYRNTYVMQVGTTTYAVNRDIYFNTNPSNCLYDVDFNNCRCNTLNVRMSANSVIFRNFQITGLIFYAYGISQSTNIVLDGFIWRGMGRYDATLRVPPGMTVQVLGSCNISTTNTACFCDTSPGSFITFDTLPADMPPAANFLTAQYPFARGGGTVKFTACKSTDYPLTSIENGLHPFVQPGTRVIMADGLEIGVDAEALVDNASIKLSDRGEARVNYDATTLAMTDSVKIGGNAVDPTPKLTAVIGNGLLPVEKYIFPNLTEMMVWLDLLPSYVNKRYIIQFGNDIGWEDKRNVEFVVGNRFVGPGSFDFEALGFCSVRNIFIYTSVAVYMRRICPLNSLAQQGGQIVVSPYPDNVRPEYRAIQPMNVFLNELIPLDYFDIVDPTDGYAYESRVKIHAEGYMTNVYATMFDYRALYVSVQYAQAAMDYTATEGARLFTKQFHYSFNYGFGDPLRHSYITARFGGNIYMDYEQNTDAPPAVENATFTINKAGAFSLGGDNSTIVYTENYEFPDNDASERPAALPKTKKTRSNSKMKKFIAMILAISIFTSYSFAAQATTFPPEPTPTRRPTSSSSQPSFSPMPTFTPSSTASSTATPTHTTVFSSPTHSRTPTATSTISPTSHSSSNTFSVSRTPEPTYQHSASAPYNTSSSFSRTATRPLPTPTPDADNKMSGGQIAGITLLSATGVAVVVGIIYGLCKQRISNFINTCCNRAGNNMNAAPLNPQDSHYTQSGSGNTLDDIQCV